MFIPLAHFLLKIILISVGSFWPRDLLKGPKSGLVVVFLVVVGVETWAKNVHNVTKNVREQNLLQIEQKNVTKGTKNFANENGV